MKATVLSLALLATATATPLHTAAAENNGTQIAALVADGAAVDAIDDSLLAPLHVAAYLGHDEAAAALLAAGADASLVCNRGRMQPLHWAAAHGHADVVKLLVGAGANLEATEEGARAESTNGARWWKPMWPTPPSARSSARWASKTSCSATARWPLPRACRADSAFLSRRARAWACPAAPNARTP